MTRHLLGSRPGRLVLPVILLLVVPTAMVALGGPASAAARQVATPRLAASAGVPASFSPESLTYVSTSDGFVLGTVACGKRRCLQLWRTTNDGASWSAVPAPPAGALQPGAPPLRIRFADPKDGWVYSMLAGQQTPLGWVTHSGGTRWSPISFPVRATPSSQLGIEDLEAAGGVVDAAVAVDAHVEILSSPVGSNAWRRTGGAYAIGAGPIPSGQLVLQGRSGWFVQVDRVVIRGARATPSGRWVTWRPPCTGAGGPVTLTAPSPSELHAVCTEGVWTGTKISVDLLSSHDGGTTFGPSHRVPASQAGLAAAASTSTVAVGTTSIARSSSTAVLEMTFNGGASWTPVYRRAGGGWLELGFTTPTQGVAIVSGANEARSTMLRTTNGGRSWAPVRLR